MYESLNNALDGEISTALSTRKLYASDASVYQKIPAAVAFPKNEADCQTLVKFAAAQGLSIIVRAAGTSLAGQVVGEGIIVDISRYMTQVGTFDVESQHISVEPGVIRDELNQYTAAEGLFFAPDTSTSNRCMIAGMAGNNSCGAYSILYGTTREHVHSIRAVLADGSIADFGPVSAEQLAEKQALNSLEGEIYRRITALVDQHQAAIIKAFPDPEIIRRNTGYALDVLCHMAPWNAQGPDFNLASLLCGSEGSLALMTELRLKLTKQPTFRVLLCPHFASLDQAFAANADLVADLATFKPAAIEIIDKATLDASKLNLAQAANRFWIEGEPEAVLVIEFFAEDEVGLQKQILCARNMVQKHQAYTSPIIKADQAQKVWDVRKAGLGLLMGKPGRKKAVAVVEDTAIAPAKLAAFIKEVQGLMSDLNVGCVYYGHASVGLIHIRPELDLAEAEDRVLFVKIADVVADLVKKYGGALSGEHGDGRLRAPFLPKILGPEVYALLQECKLAFDEQNVFNPHKIIGNLPIDSDLRIQKQQSLNFVPSLDWKLDQGLANASEKCNGAAACRKSTGVMCPSYQATKLEQYSTRGRAVLIRQAMQESDPAAALQDDDLLESLDHCLSCKGCLSECPASVDMAKLKAEVLSQQAFSLMAWSKTLFPAYLRLASFAPSIFNRLGKLALFKKLNQIHEQRAMPVIQPFQSLESHLAGGPKVRLILDVYSYRQENSIAVAAFQVLKALDCDIEIFELKHSPRLLFSSGFIKQCKREVNDIYTHIDDDRLNIGLEPSEVSIWRDEAKELLAGDVPEVLLFEEAMLQLIPQSARQPQALNTPNIAVHLHCHQKALAKACDSQQAFALIPEANIQILNTGCCGMGGEFGYKHYDMSQNIGEMSVYPAIRGLADNTLLVASGSSCRHQIDDGLSKQAMHPAQIFALAYPSA